VVTDYFLVEDLAPGGIVNVEGDHKIHVINVHGNRLELDTAFDVDFDRDINTGTRARMEWSSSPLKTSRGKTGSAVSAGGLPHGLPTRTTPRLPRRKLSELSRRACRRGFVTPS